MYRKIFLLLITLIFLTSTTEAAKTDFYRNALINKSFTIKYKVTTLPVHETAKSMTVNSVAGNISPGMVPFVKFPTFTNPMANAIDVEHGGIVVVNGNDRYTEIFHDKYSESQKKINPVTKQVESTRIETKEGGVCTLIKDGESFTFLWEMKKDSRDYYSRKGLFGKKHSIKAEDTAKMTPYQSLIEEYTYGVPEIAGALLAMMPSDKIIDNPFIPRYRFLNSGNLSNGLTFEDFVSENPTMFNATRYYFDGDSLVKIAMVKYLMSNGEIQSYEKSVIDIIEFSTTPDESYLKLPETLKDKTKRKGEDKK